MLIKLEDVFKKADVDWRAMKENESIDISNLNFRLKSFNHRTKEIENKKILSLVRKKNSKTYRLIDNETNKILFKGSAGHRIYVFEEGKLKYKSFSELLDFETICCAFSYEPSTEIQIIGKLEIEDNFRICRLEETGEEEPILDVQIEDNKNYFANGILSHNTMPGGRAIRFYSSITLQVKRKEYILEGNETKGIVISVKSTKNKTAPPMKQHLIKMSFTDGFDSRLDWIDYAIEFDVIKNPKSGSFILYCGEPIRAKARVIDYYADPEHAEEYNEVIKETKKRMYQGTENARVSADNPDDDPLKDIEANVEVEAPKEELVDEN